MINYGYMQFAVYVAMAFFMTRTRFKFRAVLVFAAIAMILTQLITLSRIMLLFLGGSIFMLVLVINHVIEIRLNKNIRFLFIASFIVLFVSQFIFTGASSYVFSTFRDTYLEISGQLPRGTTQTRTEYELPIQVAAFKSDRLFGYGYKDGAFSYEGPNAISLGDLPLLGNLALYGIVGFGFYLMIYVLILRKIRRTIKFIKRHHNPAHIFNKYDIILLTILTSYFLSLFLFRLFYFTNELVSGYNRVLWGFFIGMLMGLTDWVIREAKRRAIAGAMQD
jgi:O-antigen ligase